MSSRGFLLGVWVLGVCAAGASDAGSLGPRLARILEKEALAPSVPAAGSNRALPVLIRGEGAEPVLEALGLSWHSRSGVWVTAEIPLGHIPGLAARPEFQVMELPSPLTHSLDVSIPRSGGAGLRARLGDDWLGHTGEGVLIGVIDSGIDIYHEDFRRPDGTTRVLYLWDQLREGNPPPEEIHDGYGSEWTAWEIDAGLSNHADLLGHGTHVAGIAAGDGSATGRGQPAHRYVGVAPEADILVVAAELRGDRILDALSYLRAKAEALGRPLVVNMSLNTVTGPRNGSEPLAQAVDSFAGPGRLAVVSAGNSGAERGHGSMALQPAESGTISVHVAYPEMLPAFVDTIRAFELELYYPATESLSVALISPMDHMVGPVVLNDGVVEAVSPSGHLSIVQSTSLDPDLRVAVIFVGSSSSQVFENPVPGEWSIVLSNLGDGTFTTHGWVARRNPMSVEWGRGYDPSIELGAPATALQALAVGSVNSKFCWEGLSGEECVAIEGAVVGEGSWFSSRGPTLDGRLKPEVAAPGMAVMSSFAGTMAPPVREQWGLPQTLAADGVHVMQAGTSMSAPHVSGALALLLGLEPAMTPAAARAALIQSSGNPAWDPVIGFGALNIRSLLNVPELDLPPPPRLRAAPNPFAGEARIRAWGLEDAGPVPARVFDIQGRTVAEVDLAPGSLGEHAGVWDGRLMSGGPAAPGVYWVRIDAPQGGGAIKLVKLP